MSAEYIEFNAHKVLIKRKPRVRQSRLKVSPSGQIELIAPVGAKEAWIIDFLETSEDWLSKTLKRFSDFKRLNPEKKYVQGEAFFYLGKLLPLDFRMSFQNLLKVIPTEDSLIVMIPKAKWSAVTLMTSQRSLRPAILKELKDRFQEIAEPRVSHYAERMGLKPTSLGFRFQKTLWGSCNRRGAISLNAKLVGAPLEVLDYVIIHELAHLKHLNHSKAFWSLVEEHFANHKQPRQWLKQNAFALEV